MESILRKKEETSAPERTQAFQIEGVGNSSPNSPGEPDCVKVFDGQDPIDGEGSPVYGDCEGIEALPGKNTGPKRLKLCYEKETGAPFTDPLTGLYTHGLFQILLDHGLNKFRWDLTKCTVAILNIDWFSFLNRRKGYLFGDTALKNIGGIVKATVRKHDLASRYSDDQFAVVFVNTTIEKAYSAAERLRKQVEAAFEGNLTISIGLASCPEHGVTGETLLQKASEALRAAKMEGKNKVAVYDPSIATMSKNRHTVMIVDDSELNIKMVEAILLPNNYRIVKAFSGKEALHIADRQEIDLVLLDVMMPGMDGFEVCRTLKSRQATRMTPIILVTALDDRDSKIKGIEAGADDFITKPPNSTELITRSKSLIKLKSLYNDFTNIESVLFSLAKAVEAKNPYTKGHVSRVSSLGVALGRKLNLGPEQIEALRFGGFLHDIGKIGIPNRILNKPDPLEPSEWEQIYAHPDTGYRICHPLKDRLRLAMDVIRHHHEKLDGSGYPDGLKGDDISTVARITAVVDIFDALTTDRPYRKGMSKKKALEILVEETADQKLDSKIVACFCGIVNVKRT